MSRKKLSFQEVKSYIESFNYKLLSNEYKNSQTKLKIQCPKGHIYEVVFHNFKAGFRCPVCSGKKNHSYEYVKYFIEKYNYKLLSNEYKNSKLNLEIRCPKGHNYKVTFNHFKSGSRCPYCWSDASKSKPEIEIQEYISKIYLGKIINNDRNTILNPNTGFNLELDVYLPDINKAIEFNGTYWHSFTKTIKNDKIKIKQCQNLNINLLIIEEENWNINKNKCLNQINEFIRFL